jgi:hypothetical protein
LAGDVLHVSPFPFSLFARAIRVATVSEYAWRPMGTQD